MGQNTRKAFIFKGFGRPTFENKTGICPTFLGFFLKNDHF